MHAIKLESISHSYTNVTVLRNITASIAENKITVILGKSGSGKSTLLQMINGLIIPESGKVSLYGQLIDYGQLSKLRLGIGYSVQGISLFPHLTVHENIALLPKINGYDRSKTAERIKYLMKFVNLDLSNLNKYPHELSGGEQQRVGICRAMILNPRIFLLDEAFGALDPSTRNEIHDELLNLQLAEPRTIIMVTHDVDEAFKLAQFILILNEGIIEQYDTAENIKNKPATQFVQNFIRGIL
jgi:osmoprotectant transport system ATP-binding protein